MTYSKDKLINGVLGFVEQEIVPLMANDKPMQIVSMTAARYLRANTRLTDSIFQRPKIQTVLNYDPTAGSYDVSALLDAFRDSVKDCGGSFAVSVPIPSLWGAAQTKTVTLSAADVDKLRKYIEEA